MFWVFCYLSSLSSLNLATLESFRQRATPQCRFNGTFNKYHKIWAYLHGFSKLWLLVSSWRLLSLGWMFEMWFKWFLPLIATVGGVSWLQCSLGRKWYIQKRDIWSRHFKVFSIFITLSSNIQTITDNVAKPHYLRR